jgi:hypothetical protein
MAGITPPALGCWAVTGSDGPLLLPESVIAATRPSNAEALSENKPRGTNGSFKTSGSARHHLYLTDEPARFEERGFEGNLHIPRFAA